MEEERRHEPLPPPPAAEEETNPYLALRKAKIERNERRLQELGLLFSWSSPCSSRRTASQQRTASSATTSSRRRRSPAGTRLPPREGTRKSKRIKESSSSSSAANANAATAASADATPPLQATAVTWKRKVTQPPPPSSPSQQQPQQSSSYHRPSSGSGSRCSARELPLRPGPVLREFLGKALSRTGKAFAMSESARVGCCCDGGGDDASTGGTNELTGDVSFNKYSGAQEWGSDVVYLWVNLGAPDADVVNEFFRVPEEEGYGGIAVSWFGGSRMRDETPAVRKLVRIGTQQSARARIPTNEEDKNASDNGGDSNGTAADGPAILLWCRQYLSDKRTFTPYTCLGRLSVRIRAPLRNQDSALFSVCLTAHNVVAVSSSPSDTTYVQLISYDPNSHPIEFVFRLLDCDRLRNHPDDGVRGDFEDIVRANLGGTL